MTQIEKLILASVSNAFKLRVYLPAILGDYKIDVIADEIEKESSEYEDINEFLVDEGFPDNCAKLPFDSYVRLPYRLRTLIGLSELGMTVGDDWVPSKPNSFKYGGYHELANF